MNHFMALLYVMLMTFLYSMDGSNMVPVPPQPSQYTTSIFLNGNHGMYYADTTVQRDRMDLDGSANTLITDFENYRQYLISPGKCEWTMVGPISPLLRFPSYKFIGNVTYDGASCYKWSGCHQYEVPPAPFFYHATVNENIPKNLNLSTIDVNIRFTNFTFGPPSSPLFDLPKSCDQIEFHPKHHPMLSYRMKKHSNVEEFC
ncbi:hypothetical protein I4U23_015170 [Adineta vaga]|nr:hypothetical protein I4U23_015170 [Adineta vaga]